MTRLLATYRRNAAIVSLKVGFFLTGAADSTGFTCVPGSHRPQADGTFVQAGDLAGAEGADGAVQVPMRPGNAIIFDRRILHAAVQNLSDTPRIAIFYGYGYRCAHPPPLPPASA